MKNYLIISYVLLWNTVVFSQKAETLERLNADQFPKSKVLQLLTNANGKILTYNSTAGAPVAVPGKIPKYFVVRGKNHAVMIVSQFVNPLTYKLVLSTKTVDNPNVKVESDFFGAPQLTGLAVALPLVSGNGTSLAATAGNAPESSELLPEWIFELQITQKSQAGYPVDYHKQLATQFNNLEQYLFGDFALTGIATKKTFEKHILDVVANIKSARNFSVFTAALINGGQVYDQLNAITDATVINNLGTVVNSMKNPTGFVYTSEFKTLTTYSIEKLKGLTTEELNKKKILMNSFKLVLDYLRNVKPSGDDISLTDNALDVDRKQDLIVNYKSIKIDIDPVTLKMTEGESFEGEFTIMRGLSQLDMSAGVAWLANPITFNAFNTFADSTSYRIGNTQSIKRYLPAIFLNYYRGIDDRLTIILPQIGVGAGKEYPTIFAGAGVVIPNRLMLTFGLANSFNQTLKNGYSVNDKLDVSKVQNVRDIYDYKWESRLYFSIQLNF